MAPGQVIYILRGDDVKAMRPSIPCEEGARVCLTTRTETCLFPDLRSSRSRTAEAANYFSPMGR